MTGIVSDIISFSLNDGPGIRTTIFFKGCMMRCQWCHNPETHSMSPQTLYSAHLCVHCGRCAAICPHKLRNIDGTWRRDEEACTGCGACATECPADANQVNGRAMTAEEVCRLALRDRPFFRQRGGVTFSGGEPLMQPQFLRECAEKLHGEGVSCALETSLYAPWQALESILPFVDLFLCDWKAASPETHRKYTGVDNALIAENLCRLDAAGAKIVLRCPMIPGVNDTRDDFEAIAGLTRTLSHIIKVDILPYHDIGNDKRVKLGLSPQRFTVPDEKTRQMWLKALGAMCARPVCLAGGYGV